jgi:hypothetical protein
METTHIIPNLTPEQKERCREVLDKHSLPDARSILAEPPPRGLGIDISNPTLCRLKKRLELEDNLAERVDIHAHAGVLARTEKNEDVRKAAIETLADKAFQLSLSKDPAMLQTACRILQYVDKLEKSATPNYDLAELRLQVAKRVIHRLDEFNTFRSDKTISVERLILMIADRLFDPIK